MNRLSTPSPVTASTTTSLRSSPYRPKVIDKPIAIHGACPLCHVNHATPSAASATASHCSRPRRSPNTATPNTTLSSGLMK